MNYNPGTIGRISDVKNGITTKTSVLAAATYLLTGNTQTELFNVYGCIWVHRLYLEIVTAGSNNATTVLFNTTFTTPVIAVNNMCAASAAINGGGAPGPGFRVVWVGGAVATAAVITDSAGLSDVWNTNPHLVGGPSFVGTIGILTAAASQANGTFRAYLTWSQRDPDDGSYAEAKL